MLLLKIGFALLLCFLITAGGTVAFYTYSVNGPKMIQSAFAGNDPMTGTLINLGVLAFLAVLFVLAYALKREYWKDVH